MGLFSSSKSKSSTSKNDLAAGAQTQFGEANSVSLNVKGKKAKGEVSITNTMSDYGAIEGALEFATKRGDAADIRARRATNDAFKFAEDEAKRNDAVLLNVLTDAGKAQEKAFSEASAVIEANSESVQAVFTGELAENEKKRRYVSGLVEKISLPFMVLAALALLYFGKGRKS